RGNFASFEPNLEEDLVESASLLDCHLVTSHHPLPPGEPRKNSLAVVDGLLVRVSAELILGPLREELHRLLRPRSADRVPRWDVRLSFGVLPHARRYVRRRIQVLQPYGTRPHQIDALGREASLKPAGCGRGSGIACEPGLLRPDHPPVRINLNGV